MDATQVKVTLERRGRAVARASNWVRILRGAYGLSQPNRNVFQQQIAEGANRNFYCFDGTLVLATRRFVNKMQSGLVPQNINWFELAPADTFLNKLRKEIEQDVQGKVPVTGNAQTDREAFNSAVETAFSLFTERAARVLQDRTNEIFNYIRSSNFDPVINEALYDMAVSTGAIQLNEGDDEEPLIFSSIPADMVYFNEGPWGTIDEVFRDFVDIELDKAYQMWPGFKVPSQVRFNDDKYQLVTLYECSRYNRDTKRYTTVVIEKSTNQVCFEREDESWPFIIFRWYKLSGEVGGRGPVLDAFPSAATINKCMEDEILAADLMAKPIYLGFSDGLFNPYNFNLSANTIIPINRIASGDGPPIIPLPKAGDVGFGAIVLNDLRTQVDKLMFNTALGPIEDAPPLTATEVAIRQNEMVEDAAASFARLQRELFFPLIKRIIYILSKRGLIEPIEIDGKVLEVKFSTPLSLGKGQLDVNQFMLFFQYLSAIFGPDRAIIPLKVAQIPGFLAKNLNVNFPVIRSQAEIEQILANLEKEAQKQEQDNQQLIETQGAQENARNAQAAAVNA